MAPVHCSVFVCCQLVGQSSSPGTVNFLRPFNPEKSLPFQSSHLPRGRRKSGHTPEFLNPRPQHIYSPDHLGLVQSAAHTPFMTPLLNWSLSPCKNEGRHLAASVRHHHPPASFITFTFSDTQQRCCQPLCLEHCNSSISSRAPRSPFHHSLSSGSTAKISPWPPCLPLCPSPVYPFLLKH